jgi:hypothetical protein
MKFKIIFFLSIFLTQVIDAQVIKDCRRMPSYISTLGFDTQKSGFSTSESKYMGLTFVEFGSDGHNKVYQHPSWKTAGFLGAMLIAETGSVYVVPTPSVNTLYNKAEEQNFLYRIDATTQVMTKVAALPSAASVNTENPFGLIGLAYDCDTKIIYATSLAGSTRDRELGRVYAIQSTDYKVVAMIENIDCLGIGLGIMNGEKRLFLGRTRNNEVQSIGLDANGTFKGTPRLEIKLDGLGPRGDDVARKIRFLPDGTLQVQAVEFYYNLIAPTEKQESKFMFKYLNNKWTYLGGS